MKDWDQHIKELEEFFKAARIPAGPIRLNACTVITDTKLFIESHLLTIKNHNGSKVYYPYYERLMQLKTIINATNQVPG